LLVAAILLAPAASADWLQEGGDAAGTGRVHGAAPAWPDVALVVHLPLQGVQHSAPILLGGSLYIAEGVTNPPIGSSAYRLFRADIGTRIIDEVTVLPAEHTGPACRPALASDGQRLFLFAHTLLHIFDTETGRWEEPIAVTSPRQGVQPVEPSQCQPLPSVRGLIAYEAGQVFVALAANNPGGPALVRLFAVDWKNRTVEGPWVDTGETDMDRWVGITEPVPDGVDVALRLVGLNVAEGRAVVSLAFQPLRTLSTLAGVGGTEAKSTGGRYWSVDTRSGDSWVYDFLYTDRETPPSPALLGGTMVFVRIPILQGLEGGTGDILSENNGVAEVDDLDGRMAYRDGVLYTPIGSRLHAFDEGLRPVWVAPARIDGLRFVGGALIFDDAVVATAAASAQAPSTLLAFHPGTGAPLWSHDLAGPAQVAGRDGLVVAVDGRGLLTVLGETPYSLRPGMKISSLYPRTGEEARVDLSTTPASPAGPPSAFSADWGDDTETGWQDEPVLRHVYSAAGDAHARFFVRNEAGQIASVGVTFHVGQKDPTVNIFNSPFAAEYQETSFFLLGLLATGFLAAFGVLRAGRKRRKFNRELHALETDHHHLGSQPAEHEHMLAARRARIRSLFLARKLEDAHAAFLTTRIDEMRHAGRLAEIEDRLEFLPHGMFKTLHVLLHDARISAFERQQFLQAVARERRLTVAQKDEVTRIVEAWFARDKEIAT
jgi:outer membrane protein assembly factor BamB